MPTRTRPRRAGCALRKQAWPPVASPGPGAARAVGLACGKNPIAIVVPCHRVITSACSLGGFSGGLRIKRRLLALEGTLAQLKR